MNLFNRTYQFQTAGKIVAGPNSLQSLGENLYVAGQVRKALLVAQGAVVRLGFAGEIVAQLSKGGVAVEVMEGVMQEPSADHIEKLHRRIEGEHFDVFIGIGGGSVLDTAKLLSVMQTNRLRVREMLGTDMIPNAGIPTILIPTTSGTGSEVTPNAIVTLPEDELKIGIVSRHLFPKLVVLDPVLTLDLPQPITAATGMDAFTHSLESYISNKANPISDMFALESIRLISGSIVESYSNGRSIQARNDMLLGSMYGGMALTGSGTAAVHAMAYPLGGKFNIPHGVANSMLLPHVTEFNLDRIGDRLADVAQAMGIMHSNHEGGTTAEKAIEQIVAWTKQLEIPQDLTAFGVEASNVPALAEAAFGVRRLMDNNPKQMTVSDIEKVYSKLLP